jgi:hypothetical protein
VLVPELLLLLSAAGVEAGDEPPSGNEGNEGIKAATDDQRLAEDVVGGVVATGGRACGTVSPFPTNFKFFISGVTVPDAEATTGCGTSGNASGTGKGFIHFSKNLITGISETIVV